MQDAEANNRDHNYSEVKNHLRNDVVARSTLKEGATRAAINKQNRSSSNREPFGQVKDINELKKITPRVKLLAPDASTLNELTKLSSHGQLSIEHKLSILEQTKQELKKYCRTCAGSKLPLVDIFGEKGVQMRLSQQIKHLEDINPYDSLSTQMCMDCICDLKMSYKFFMQIKKAEVKLKSIHGTLTEAAARKEVNRLRTVSASNEAEEKSQKTDKEDTVQAASTSNERKEIKKEQQREEKTDKELVQKLEPETIVFTVKEEPQQEKENNDNDLTVKSEPDMFDETAVHQQSDDNESIEEFDPDDPPNQPDSSEDEESDEGLDNSRIESMDGTDTMDNETTDSIYVCNDNSVHNDTIVDSNQTVYKYDTALKAYIKMEGNEDSNNAGGPNPAAPKAKPASNVESTKESKQPNILKRRAPPQARKSTVSETDDSGQTDRNGGFKVQKLDVHNPLNINNSQEDGIMYVTVKGSKPNEILLVKVKKMEKPLEKKDDKSAGKKGTDAKDLFLERSRRSDTREQIIEEQIEEYKRKREKVLGGQTNTALKPENAQPRNFRRSDNNQETQNRQTYVPQQNVPTKVDTDKEDNDTNTTVHTDNEISEESNSTKEKPVEKQAANTEEYLSRLAKLKLKWEEAKRKKESLQKQLDESYTEGNSEKLKRILGEKEKNLQEFQDYLKQRQIVITRLKDEDIISLYEDRNNAAVKSNFPDLIDEAQPVDYVPEQRYLECDYCIETFSSKEVLEEHLKTHDYKIMHYCEDCTEEFPTNKAKRNHNMACIKKLLCKYCDLMLDSKGKKRQHEQKHCDSIFGQLCDVCGEKFKHQGTLDQHVKTQHMSWEKIYQCPKCPKKFAFKQKLSFHLKSVHTTLRAYLCEDCGADFKNPASLRHHRIRKHQPVGNKRECPVCHKLVPFYSLSKHMHTHKAYTIQCPHCDKMFKNSSTLKQHVRIHEDQRQYRCDTCGVGFNRRDGLRLHMRVHEKTDSRGLKECSCQVCGEKFPNHSTLVIHRNRVHKDGRQYTCHICNRSMISTRSLEWHMSHIHNESLPGLVKDETDGAPEKKRVSCYHCNKTFKTEMILRTHIKNTHMEKDPMKCLDCEMTFTSEVRLRHHMMVTHNRLEGTLACPHCPKRFVNQLRLKTHMISHSEERPYTCEICGFNLKTKIQLIKHHQNRHSDERPLQCNYCPWRCKQVSALVCHERTHTNERPYSCSVCRQRFKYLGDKNKHERRHESLGGSGFKRIVHGRNVKVKVQEDSSASDPEQEALASVEQQLTEGQYDEQSGQQYPEESIVKFEEQEITEEYEQVYEQEYEETSREASDAAEVIMNMEDTTVYTEEVTADNIESAEIMADEMMTNEILQSGTVVHLQQEDDSGKIQVIPVMLSLPDLSDTNTEVNLATASIMYNN